MLVVPKSHRLGLLPVEAPDTSVSFTNVQAERPAEAQAEVGLDMNPGDVKLVDFGAFVNFFGKRDGLVHVSQIENRRLNHPSDVLKEGQEVWVKLLGFDDRGKVRLSMKVVNQETGEEMSPEQQKEAAEG